MIQRHRFHFSSPIINRLHVFLIGLFAGLLIPLIATAQSDRLIGNNQPIKHPGNVELIYHGILFRTPPLLPLTRASVQGKEFWVQNGVVVPSIQSVYLLEHTEIRPGEEVLDIGTGSGVQAIFAAQKARRVLATDIDYAAVANARMNAERHNLSHIISVIYSDLFNDVPKNQPFDAIIFNINYPYDEASAGLWRIHERFFAEAHAYLKPGGRIYYQAGLIENIPRIQQMVTANGFKIMKMNMVDAPRHNRVPIVFMIKQAAHANWDDTP